MSSIHYFQRYSQKENVATNNTLLLLSRLYQDSPIKFRGFLNDLLDDNFLEAGINFNQQVKGKNSVPDGSLSQVSFKVVIETKLHEYFLLQQLIEHLESFDKEQYQVLLSLSPKEPDNSLKLQIESEVAKFNAAHNTTIKYLPTTFQEIVNKFKNSIEDYDFKLLEIVNDFEEYCIIDELITDEDSRMRVVTCGWTLKENFQFNLYFDSVSRGYSDHSYLGIYHDKCVQGIGKIENIISADLLPNGSLQIIDHTELITAQQQINIIGIIAAVKANNNWQIETGHKFFCVEQFYPTNFCKTTKFPLQGAKFFKLKEILKVPTLPATKQIAQLLNQITW